MKNQQHIQQNSLTLIIIAISTALLAISMWLIGPHKHINLITDFYQVTNLLSDDILNGAAAFAFMVSALLAFAAIKQPPLKKALGYLLIGISVIPLIALFSNAMWIEAMGGFPVIGSGQGVIKYFALLSLGILFIKADFSAKTQAWLSVFPVLIVLVWIGGMKFTLLEAQGIEDLVASSPFMGWMYNFFSLQTTSNIIGIYDLAAVALLILAIYDQRLLWPAVVMSGMVFIVTQSFLITFTGSLSAQTLLTTTGHFLIKDLWFLANLIFYYTAVKALSKPE